MVAIAGLPPMGIFMTEFLIVTSTFARAPALAIILGLSLLVALGALLLRLNGLAFGDPDGRNEPAKASFVPVGLHLALVLARHLAAAGAGRVVPARGDPAELRWTGPRSIVDRAAWEQAGRSLQRGRAIAR